MATKIKLIADNVITTSQIDTSSLDAHFTGGTGVTYSSGTISIGQAVHSTDSPTFADLTLTGNLNITGDINSYNVTDLDVTDQTITLGAGQTEALSGGSGIIVDGSNASLLWNETNDVFDFNKGLTTTGNVGIGGTATAGYKLDVIGGADQVRISSASDAPLIIRSTDTTTGLRFVDDTSSMYLFYDGAYENLYWTTAVDLGIGTVPKAHSTIRGIDIGYSGFFGARDTNSATNYVYILNNAWYNGTNWISKNAGDASLLLFNNNGSLYYYTDGSATASGDTLSFATSAGQNKIFSAHPGSGDGDFLIGYGTGANESAANRSVLAVQGQSTSAVVLQPGGTTQAYLLTATNDTQLVAQGTAQALNLETSSNGRIRFKTGGTIRGQIDGASTQRYQHYANISVAPSVGSSTSDSSATVMIGGGLAGGTTFGQPDVTLTDNTGYGQGIFWHDENGYGIYRTPGAWTGGDYQQLKLAWATGIIIDPSGLASGEQTYNKDYLDIQGVTRNSTGNQPGFRATNAYVTESNGRGIVKFGSVVYNQGSDFDGSTGTFTAPYDGLYIFTFNFLFQVGGVGYVRCLFALNGTSSVQYGDNLFANTGTTVISTGSSAGSYTTTINSYMDGGLCQIFKLSANDTITLDNQGVPLYSHTGQTTYSSFSGYFLG